MDDDFKFQGKKTQELKAMSTKEFAGMIPARQRRSIKRGFTEQQKILLKKLEKKDNIKTHCRDMIIVPQMIGKTLRIYSGKEFVTLRIMEEMIGHYLGEFVLTRKRVSHSSPGVGATRSSSSVSVR